MRTFTTDITFDQFDAIESHIKNVMDKYAIKGYFISFEPHNDLGLPKPHYHYIIDYALDTENNHNNFVKTIVDKWNLRTTSKGGKRKYANGSKNQVIKDLTKSLTYMTKHHTYRHFNITDEAHLKKCEEASFVKDIDTTIDYMQQLKQNILKEFDDENWIPKFNHSTDDYCYYNNSNKYQSLSKNLNEHRYRITLEEPWKQVEVIQEIVFNKLLKQDKPIKSFSMIKTITRHIIQYSSNDYINKYKFKLFKANG